MLRPRVHERCSLAESAAPCTGGAPGREWRRRLPGLPGFLLPGGASPSSMRAAGGPRGHCHRHLFARLSPGARAALRAGPPPRGRVGGDARASQPGSSFCSSSSPAKPGHRHPGVPCLSPLGSERRAPGSGRPGAPRGRRLAPGDILRPRSDRVAALGDEAPCAPGGLLSATGFSSGLFPAAAAASGHVCPHGYTRKTVLATTGDPSTLRRGGVTFPGLTPARPLPPQRHAWPRCRGNSNDAQRKG